MSFKKGNTIIITVLLAIGIYMAFSQGYLKMPLAVTGSGSYLPLAGWRSSAYGYQTGSPPSYWINVAKDISSKFPGTTPGGIWLVGETDGDPATGTILYMPSSGTYSNIRFEGGDIAEPYLTAFDNAGVKVILQVEPMNADVNTLIGIVMNRYKNHPSVIGFGVDNEWYKTCSEGCKATAAEVTSWDNTLHAINSNYVLMIKHFDEAKLPTGIPADVLVVDDDEQNGNLNTLVSEHVAMASHYPNNPYGAQYGYPSDSNIWSSMSNPVKQIGDAIKTALSNRIISVFWVDFSIKTIYPPATWNVCTSNCNVTQTCTPNWNVGAWSSCAGGTQTRTVTDSNNCGVTTNKPSTTQTCTVACVPSWTCNGWSTCANNLQTRTCTDSNNCNILANRPVQSQACTSQCSPSWTCTLWSECVNTGQTRNCVDSNNCGLTSGKPIEFQSCSVACTADAKLCPDGSYVSRIGNNCEFAACPASCINGAVQNMTCTNGRVYNSKTCDASGKWNDINYFMDPCQQTSTENNNLYYALIGGAVIIIFIFRKKIEGVL
jgi:hypothetical protein